MSYNYNEFILYVNANQEEKLSKRVCFLSSLTF